MPTKREIGRRLYYRPASVSTVSSAAKVGATSSTSTAVRYGVAKTDSAEGKVQVKLDNSDDAVTCNCDSIIRTGDRVKVIVTESGELYAMPIGNNIVSYVDRANQELANRIEETGQSIIDEVKPDIDKVNQALEDVNKRADELAESMEVTSTTITDLSSKVEGAASDASAAMTAVSEAVQDLNGFKQTVSQTYATKGNLSDSIAQEVLDRNSAIEQSATSITLSVSQNYQSKSDAERMEADLNAAIKVNADNITSSVSSMKSYADRAASSAASGALSDANDYTDGKVNGFSTSLEDLSSKVEQLPGEITSTVEENVMNSVGETYATKSELEQQGDSVRLEISSTIAQGYATCATPASTRSKVANTQASNDITLSAGVTVAVKFTYANTASSPTLNVDGTGAKTIRVGSSTMTTDQSWDANSTVSFVYDGAYWVVADSMAYGTSMTIGSYFQADTSGLTVGRKNDNSAVRMSADGEFQVLESDSPLFTIGAGSDTGGYTYANMQVPNGGFVFSGGSNVMRMTDTGFSISNSYPGFSVNGVRTVEVMSFVPSSATGYFSRGLSVYGTMYRNISMVGIQYTGYGDGEYYLKVPLEYYGSTTAILYCSATSGNGISFCAEKITLTINSTGTFSCTRGTDGPVRVAVSSSTSANMNPGTCFRINRVYVCA